MRSKIKLALAASMHALLFSVLPCLAQDKQVCDVKVAALTVPDGSDGLLHWREGNTPTVPLQLSIRYFSESVKLKGNVIQFYQNPVLPGSTEETPPEPLVTLKIPPGTKLAYIVLWSETGDGNQARWQGRLLNAKDWAASSMKVFNTCSEPLGITAGKKKIQLAVGKSVDFHAREWSKAFPVKIFRLQPELKTVFSASWRVTEGRRELLFIGGANGSVRLRALIDLGETKPATAP